MKWKKITCWLFLSSILLSSCKFSLPSFLDFVKKNNGDETHIHTCSKATIENNVEPTCTVQGSYDEVFYCDLDKLEIDRKHHIVPALGHSLIHHDAKAPTSDEIGWEAYDTCERCDYSTYQELSPLETPPTEEEIEFQKEIEELENLEESEGNTVEQDATNLETRLYDVSPDYTFYIVSDLSSELIKENVSVIDGSEEEQLISVTGVGGNEYSVSPVQEYDSSSFYTITLGDDVYFKDKAESVKEITFNIYRDSPNIVEVAEDKINYFPLDLITDISISEEELIIYSKEALNLHEGDIFCFSNEQTFTADSIIGEFISEIPVDGGYQVNFNEPDLSEIFEIFDINKTEQMEFDNTSLYDLSDIETQISQSLELRRLALAAGNVFGVSNSVKEFFKNIRVEAKASLKSNTCIRFELLVKTKVKLASATSSTYNSFLHFQLTLLSEISYDLSANATVKRGWFGIVKGLDASIDLIENRTCSLSFTIGIGSEFSSTEEVSKSVKDKIAEEMEKYKSAEKINDFVSKLDEAPPIKTDNDSNTLKFPLCKTHFYFFGILDILFEVSFELELNLEVNLCFKFTQTSSTKIGSYSTKSGLKTYSNPPSLKTKSLDVSLYGEIDTKAYLSVSLSAAITGLRWLFEIGIKGRVGVYVDLRGFYNYNTLTPNDIQGGYEFEVGILFDVKLYVKLLFVKAEATLAGRKFPLYYNFEGSWILGFASENEKVEIDDSSLSADFSALFPLSAYIFALSNNVEKNKAFYGYNESTSVYYPAYNCSVSVVEGIEYFDIGSDGMIIFKQPDVLHWTGQVKITFTIQGKIIEDYVEIEYKDKNASLINFEGIESEYYANGTEIYLPNIEDTTDKDFLGWQSQTTGEFYPKGTTLSVEGNDTFVQVWDNITYFTVNFYNGYNTLISSQSVRRGYDAVAPDESSCYIPGYEFVGWDHTYTNIMEDTDVYGIYVRVV